MVTIVPSPTFQFTVSLRYRIDIGSAKSGDIEPITALRVAPIYFTDATQNVDAMAIPRIPAIAIILIPLRDGIRIPFLLDK